jgi:hypothetical protein
MACCAVAACVTERVMVIMRLSVSAVVPCNTDLQHNIHPTAAVGCAYNIDTRMVCWHVT